MWEHTKKLTRVKQKKDTVFLFTGSLNDVKMEDGQPFSIMKQYTLSLNEKSALYKDLCAWRKKTIY